MRFGRQVVLRSFQVAGMAANAGRIGPLIESVGASAPVVIAFSGEHWIMASNAGNRPPGGSGRSRGQHSPVPGQTASGRCPPRSPPPRGGPTAVPSSSDGRSEPPVPEAHAAPELVTRARSRSVASQSRAEPQLRTSHQPGETVSPQWVAPTVPPKRSISSNRQDIRHKIDLAPRSVQGAAASRPADSTPSAGSGPLRPRPNAHNVPSAVPERPNWPRSDPGVRQEPVVRSFPPRRQDSRSRLGAVELRMTGLKQRSWGPALPCRIPMILCPT